ncbi:MAG: orotidine 5'-phosphate decarboxylase [Bombilactobacillus mellifer]|nr:orotidine 5'-phosphate decarboxylase [Bombilactobacillus mellifer]
MQARLQVALDAITLNGALNLIEKIQDDIDIVEVGTPLLMHYGMNVVEKLFQNFPKLPVLCDAKIMDAGNYEAGLAFDAGAEYVTVLALADDLTIQGVTKAAHDRNKKVVVDLINVTDLNRIEKLEQFGVDVIAIHTGADAQAAGQSPLDDLKEIRPLVKKADLAVAGGIKTNTIEKYLKEKPEIVIVGGGILNQADSVAAAHKLHQAIQRG